MNKDSCGHEALKDCNCNLSNMSPEELKAAGVNLRNPEYHAQDCLYRAAWVQAL